MWDVEPSSAQDRALAERFAHSFWNGALEGPADVQRVATQERELQRTHPELYAMASACAVESVLTRLIPRFCNGLVVPELLRPLIRKHPLRAVLRFHCSRCTLPELDRACDRISAVDVEDVKRYVLIFAHELTHSMPAMMRGFHPPPGVKALLRCGGYANSPLRGTQGAKTSPWQRTEATAARGPFCCSSYFSYVRCKCFMAVIMSAGH